MIVIHLVLLFDDFLGSKYKVVNAKISIICHTKKDVLGRSSQMNLMSR